MEFLKLKIEEYKKNEEEYNEYKSKIQDITKLLKQNKKYEKIFKSFDLFNNKNMYLYFIFFQNFEKYIYICFENNKNNINSNKLSLILRYLKTKNINNNDNNKINIQSLFIQWIFYFYIKFIKNFYTSLNPNFCEINKIRYLLREANYLIIKLYKENIFNTSQVFDNIKFCMFLIENNFEIKSFSDKLYKAKNYLLFQTLFFMLIRISKIIFERAYNNNSEKENDNKTNIQIIFSFLEEFQNSKEINSPLNKMMLINSNLLPSFMNELLNMIDIKIILKYEPNIKNKLLNFFSNFIKFNYKKSKIYNLLLNTLKNSFINLSNLDNDKNKNKIINDLFLNSFYIKLLKKIFYYDENNNILHPLFDSFYFNGFDSQLSLNVINSHIFDKSCLFFSFYLSPLEGKKKYPLFLIQMDFDNKKQDLLSLYLKQDEENKSGRETEKEYFLFFYDGKKEKKLDNIQKIKSNITYYFSLCFNSKKLLINFCSKKDQIISYEIDKNCDKFKKYSISLLFGFYKKKDNVFSGYFGPIIIVKNPKNSKELKEFISSILKLGANYKNFLFLNKNSNYYSENLIHFQNNKEKELNFKSEEIECLLYLIPEIFPFFSNKSRIVNHLPNIDCICPIQRSYNIYNLNITLIKHEQGIINFIIGNGLNYICLLYEYIYQLYFQEQFIENNDIFEKMILSIFKKTLFILEKSYHEIKVDNFNKCFKQIYMNLFSCFDLINKKHNIIDYLIDYFLNITKHYYNFISNILKKKLLPWSNKIDLDDNILKMNLSCLNGLVLFLLNNYKIASNNSIIKLFNALESYFDYIKVNKKSEKVNQYLFKKLLNFIPYLYDNSNNNKSNNDISINDNNYNKNIDNNNINSIDEKKEIYDSYFRAIKSFFENNPSKSENINNLKNIFNIINENENINESNEFFYRLYNFINELIDENLDFYFNDEKDNEQIIELIEYSDKIYKRNKIKQGKNEKEIQNKSILFNKLISIIIRIIFSKQKIGNNKLLIQKFKNMIEKIDITKELISSISSEIKNIINNLFESKNNLNNNNIAINQKSKGTKQNIYDSKELKNISNFYFEIFDLILHFFEQQKYSNEDVIIDLFGQIIKIITSMFDNNDKQNRNNSNIFNINDENSCFLSIHIIYCLINLLKIYNIILFKNFYSLEFIHIFIDLCELYYKSALIYSNIMIEIEEDSGIFKTPLEIIFDICISYIYFISIKFCEDISKKEKEVIAEEQTIIYNFIKNLLPLNDSKSKELNKKYTIFFINDYFRYLSSNYPIDSKKKPKNDEFYNEFIKQFNYYQYIDKYLFNEEKFNVNFSTFFILKCNLYKKILFDLIGKVLEKIPQAKDILKFDDLLTLIIQSIQKIYLEHEILINKNKNFFFKKSITSYNYYSEIKKKIEYNHKNNNYLEIDDYILKEIIQKDYDIDNINSFYSGLCTSKKLSVHFHKHSDGELNEQKLNKKLHHVQSSSNIKKYNNEKMIRTFSDDKAKKKLNQRTFISQGQNEISESQKSINQDDNDFELCFEETPNSEYNKLKMSDDNLNNDSIPDSPSLSEIKNPSDRKKTFASTSSFNDNFNISDKKSKVYRNCSFISEISIESNSSNNISYTNYFNEPDECFLKNPKKELMMTIFSLYFFDAFFKNNNFKLMKNYYLQNFEGIQKSTKLLDYPSKIKNFNNGLDPCLFLKPYSNFFINKTFPIAHKYFYDYMKKNDIKIFEPIILNEKPLPEINLEEKFDKKCELIKINKSYYGHIIGSKNVNYIIFEKQEFYKNSDCQINNLDLNDLFTLKYINKKPFAKKTNPNTNTDEKESSPERKIYKKGKTIIILFDEIEEILERRFLLMWQSLEIFLKNGKSYFFNFLTKDQYNFIFDLFKNNNLTKDKIHDKDFFKNNQITKEWKEERLSTYEYLLFLNKYSSRTFNDVNQYPIFPWLITKYQQEKENNNIKLFFRNFKYPMAAQIEENRINAFNRFSDDEESGIKFPVHYGTHYSTSSYIYFYLMREEPFTTLLIKLQGNKQENPDRMFFSLSDTLFVLESGSDNRELIPDIFCKTEHFINLNCCDFGCKNCGLRVDDFLVSITDNINLLLNKNNNQNEIKNYTKFIIDNRKLFDEKIIRNNINEWFDNVFGIGQLPDKNMKKCYNIFNKETYEQKTELNKKLTKLQNKYKNPDQIRKKIENKIDLIISFGQTPYQIFNEKHPKNENKIPKQIQIENEEEDDFESNLGKFMWYRNIKGQTQTLPLYFEINISLGKVFLIDINRKLEIIESNYYNDSVNNKGNFSFTKIGILQLSHIKFFEKIKINENSKNLFYIIKQKYSFSSFNKQNCLNNNENDDNDYISYYNSYINELNNENSKKGKTSNKEEYFRFISCRYIDNSFKIHEIAKDKQKNISIICEDFVTSCCTLNYNKFLIGLKNGKLIQWSIENELNSENPKFKIKLDKQIQAHYKSVTVIEIDTRLGIIITAGEDNYIFIRKIYDLELITPIKIKSKYIITMAKVSPMNFLYLICCNKKKKKRSIILGYTLNGLYFSKSKYGYYDSLDFTKSGNIVTWGNKKEIEILYGDSLKNISINKDDKDMKEVYKNLSGSTWIKFNYFSRKNDIEQSISKIITYTIYDKNKTSNWIKILDVSKNKYFD